MLLEQFGGANGELASYAVLRSKLELRRPTQGHRQSTAPEVEVGNLDLHTELRSAEIGSMLALHGTTWRYRG
jgi:hypothetical protein